MEVRQLTGLGHSLTYISVTVKCGQGKEGQGVCLLLYNLPVRSCPDLR